MSKPETKNDIPISRSPTNNEPKVLIAVAGKKRDINCDYPNQEIIFQSNNTVSNLYNSIKNRDRGFAYFLYLGHEHKFADQHGLQLMVDTLKRYNNVAALYTDLVVKEKDKEICLKHNPAYNINLYLNKMMLNTPFICRSSIAPLFTQNVNTLYLWDGLLEIMKKTIIFHLPVPIFELDNAMQRCEIDKDFKLINNARY